MALRDNNWELPNMALDLYQFTKWASAIFVGNAKKIRILADLFGNDVSLTDNVTAIWYNIDVFDKISWIDFWQDVW